MSKTGAVLKAIAVTAQLTSTELSEAALEVFEADLSGYSEEQILAALTRCRRELSGRLTVSAVIDRISCAGGHPTANEAWGVVMASADESDTVIWTDQIAEAAGIARPILDAGDEVGARMAFRDAYERIVRDGGDAAPRWFPSLGHDPEKRQAAIERAVSAGRMTQKHASGLLPAPVNASGAFIAGLLTGKAVEMPKAPEFKRRISGLLAQLKGKDAA